MCSLLFRGTELTLPEITEMVLSIPGIKKPRYRLPHTKPRQEQTPDHSSLCSEAVTALAQLHSLSGIPVCAVCSQTSVHFEITLLCAPDTSMMDC